METRLIGGSGGDYVTRGAVEMSWFEDGFEGRFETGFRNGLGLGNGLGNVWSGPV
jgi:hypothetical protein